MTNETNPAAGERKVDYQTHLEKQNQTVQSTLDRFLSTADVERAYGEPIQHGDHWIIPTAEVVAGLGFGVGAGHGGDGDAGGSGGGGGGRAYSRPVAVVVVGPEGVEVKPVLDVTKIALTALTAFGFVIATLGQFHKRPRT